MTNASLASDPYRSSANAMSLSVNETVPLARLPHEPRSVLLEPDQILPEIPGPAMRFYVTVSESQSTPPVMISSRSVSNRAVGSHIHPKQAIVDSLIILVDEDEILRRLINLGLADKNHAPQIKIPTAHVIVDRITAHVYTPVCRIFVYAHVADVIEQPPPF